MFRTRRVLALLPLLALGLAVAGQPAPADEPAAPQLSPLEKGILEQANAFRRDKAKAKPVKPNAELMKAAREYAQYVAKTGKFSHEADGRKPWDRTRAAGYKDAFLSENIAWIEPGETPSDAELARQFVQGWYDSPPHRKNLLDPYVDDIGIGAAKGEDGKWYGVQDFGIPKSKEITFKVINQTGGPITYTVDGRQFTSDPEVFRTHFAGKPMRFELDQPKSAEKAEPIRMDVKMSTQVTVRKEDGRYRVE